MKPVAVVAALLLALSVSACADNGGSGNSNPPNLVEQPPVPENTDSP